MKKKVVCYIEVADSEIAEYVAIDFQEDLKCCDGITKSWVEVQDLPESETLTIPWKLSR